MDFLKISPPRFVAGIFFFLFFLFGRVFAEDALITASIAEPSNLLPLFASDSASAQVSGLIFNGLVKYDKDLKLVGDLAVSWEILEGGLVIIFHLRKDVLWQDGAPFDAADVEFTFRQLTDPTVPTPYGGDFEKVKSLTVLDPHTVQVTYREPFSPGLASWSMGMLPAHLLRGENLLKTSFSRKPVGTGPYRMAKWKTGEFLELTANEAYFEGPPGIRHFILRVIPDPATSFLELETEALDLAALSPLQFEKETDSAFFKSHYRKYRLPSFGYAYVGYNLKNPLFSDVRVRRAIGLAIPKEEIIRTVLLGKGRVATGPFLPGTWAASDAVQASPYQPQESARLLQEAGWHDQDGDGILEKNGQKFSFALLTNHGSDERKMACEVIQQSLSKIGIRVEIRIIEWRAFLKEFIDKRKFDAVLLAWQLSRDPDIFDLFHSSKTSPGQFNFVSYENPEADRLLEEGRRFFDEAARAKIYHRLHEILSRDEPYTFLYVPETLLALHARFEGAEPAAAGLTYNLIRWRSASGKEKYDV